VPAATVIMLSSGNQGLINYVTVLNSVNEIVKHSIIISDCAEGVWSAFLNCPTQSG
jgi:hypothetical protein